VLGGKYPQSEFSKSGEEQTKKRQGFSVVPFTSCGSIFHTEFVRTLPRKPFSKFVGNQQQFNAPAITLVYFQHHRAQALSPN